MSYAANDVFHRKLPKQKKELRQIWKNDISGRIYIGVFPMGKPFIRDVFSILQLKCKKPGKRLLKTRWKM